MNHNKNPVNKQSSLFLSRKNHAKTVNEALEGAINKLMKGDFNDTLANAFTGEFGPEPVVLFKISIRRDIAHAGQFVYMCGTSIHHTIGTQVKLYGLNP